MKHFLKYLKLISVFVFMAGLACSCVEPFEVNLIDYDRAIVVEGRITDTDHGHYVKLSYTRPIDQQRNDPVKGAAVWIEVSDGSRINFYESSPGYYTCADGISGKAGLVYQLFFVTSNDLAYQSNQQELIASPPIDSIYHAYAEKASRTSGDLKKGIQFFLDTHDDLNRAQYYRYDWEETWEVKAAIPSLYIFTPDPDTVKIREFDVSPCYLKDKNNSIIIGTTSNMTQNRLSELPLRYITNETDHLSEIYSILARQLVISREAYSYYRMMLENNQDNGSLFDKQLGAVVGNIISINNSDETVLGYFEVAGVSEKRLFVKFKDLDRRFPVPENPLLCGPHQTKFLESIDSIKYYVEKQNYGVVTAGYRFQEIKALVAPQHCTDCRFRGPVTKPDFWIF